MFLLYLKALDVYKMPKYVLPLISDQCIIGFLAFIFFSTCLIYNYLVGRLVGTCFSVLLLN